MAELGAWAFSSFEAKTVEINGPITSIPNYAFDRSSIESIKLSDNIELIESCAFFGSELKSIVLPKNLKEIGYYAFGFCSSLTEIKLGEQISAIGDGAFEGCDLRTVKLGSALRSVGDATFNKNYNLKNVYCNSTVVPSAFDNSFLEGYDATLHVPQGARQRYMIAPGWRYFANIVQDESLSGVDEVSVDGESVPVEYYDLQGRRVENPTNGVYIKRQGSKVEKVIK